MSAANKIVNVQAELDKIASVMSEITGNQFGEKQRSMIESRLKKRAMDLNLPNIETYVQFFWSHQKEESNFLVSVLTTHHTYFFREFSHFEYLEEKALQSLVTLARQRPDKKIRLWSAACSRGHEVYSLAMFMDHYLNKFAPDVSYDILGTDIDPESVSLAKNGVYTRKEIKEVPLAYLGDHWARGTGDIADYVKVKTSLRTKTRWETLNLLAIPPSFNEKFDIIFCRNVFIYFNQEQIKKITTDLINRLNGDGYLFVGISESINGLGLPIISEGPSIHRHKDKATKPAAQTAGLQSESTSSPSKPGSVPSSSATNLSPSSHARPLDRAASVGTSASPGARPDFGPSLVIKEKLRVLCVDDSPSIHALMKKMLQDDGFEIVGFAINGLDAAKKVKELNPDVMTLDIHMPEQSGVEYLQKNHHAKHPPVVMVTSVSREDSDLAMKALKSGASDYIEKPALSNMAEIGEELRRKLRSAYRNKMVYQEKSNIRLDEEFKKLQKIEKPENLLRVVVAHLADKERVERMIQELGRGQPPTAILIDGSTQALPQFAQSFKYPIRLLDAVPETLKTDELVLLDLKSFGAGFKDRYKPKPVSIIVFGEPSKKAADIVNGWPKSYVMAEDLGPKANLKNPVKAFAKDIMPATSFAYMSQDWLGRQK